MIRFQLCNLHEILHLWYTGMFIMTLIRQKFTYIICGASLKIIDSIQSNQQTAQFEF